MHRQYHTGLCLAIDLEFVFASVRFDCLEWDGIVAVLSEEKGTGARFLMLNLAEILLPVPENATPEQERELRQLRQRMAALLDRGGMCGGIDPRREAGNDCEVITDQ